jgi:hypothetical protein
MAHCFRGLAGKCRDEHKLRYHFAVLGDPQAAAFLGSEPQRRVPGCPGFIRQRADVEPAVEGTGHDSP